MDKQDAQDTQEEHKRRRISIKVEDGETAIVKSINHEIARNTRKRKN